jgi:hypothetical protein
VRSRFVSNLIVLIAAATLVAFSLVFRARVLAWIGFGFGCLVVVTVLAAFVARGRGAAQRVVDVMTLSAGGWLIAASRSFAGPPLKWICFGTGVLLAGQAVIGLVVHEISMELALRLMGRESPDGRARASRRDRAPVR